MEAQMERLKQLRNSDVSSSIFLNRFMQVEKQFRIKIKKPKKRRGFSKNEARFEGFLGWRNQHLSLGDVIN